MGDNIDSVQQQRGLNLMTRERCCPMPSHKFQLFGTTDGHQLLSAVVWSRAAGVCSELSFSTVTFCSDGEDKHRLLMHSDNLVLPWGFGGQVRYFYHFRLFFVHSALLICEQCFFKLVGKILRVKRESRCVSLFVQIPLMKNKHFAALGMDAGLVKWQLNTKNKQTHWE